MLVLHQFIYVLFTLRCTFIHFLALTYWQDATVLVSCFLLFCISGKLYRKYSRNSTKQKPKFIFYRNEDGVQRRFRGAPQGGHTCPLRGPGSGHAKGWSGPLGVHRPRPSTYLFTISGKTLIPEPPSTKSSVATAIADPSSGGFWSSSRHPAGEGDHHRRPLHRHARLQSDAWVFHLWTTGP
jgi:hypothetical protein